MESWISLRASLDVFLGNHNNSIRCIAFVEFWIGRPSLQDLTGFWTPFQSISCSVRSCRLPLPHYLTPYLLAKETQMPSLRATREVLEGSRRSTVLAMSRNNSDTRIGGVWLTIPRQLALHFIHSSKTFPLKRFLFLVWANERRYHRMYYCCMFKHSYRNYTETDSASCFLRLLHRAKLHVPNNNKNEENWDLKQKDKTKTDKQTFKQKAVYGNGRTWTKLQWSPQNMNPGNQTLYERHKMQYPESTALW